ncbi:MAG: hypothetical protein NUK54_09205, partial [Methanothrix sp.]|nr:hypothetical protein [Methanothrix sp.]
FGLFGEEKKEQPCEDMWIDRPRLVAEGTVDLSVSQNINQLEVHHRSSSTPSWKMYKFISADCIAEERSVGASP